MKLIRAAMDPNESYVRRHQIDLTELRPLSNDVRTAAQQIIDMNLAHMEFGRGGAHDMTRNARQAMHILALVGILLAGAIIVFATMTVLRPLRLLERSARQIAGGNLELAVPIRSRDEIGQLSRAFNDMAAQLREFKRIDHEKLVRTQLTTQLAIDSLPDAVALIEPRGQIELVNDTATRLFQLAPGGSVMDQPSPWLSDLHQEALTSNEPRRPTALAAAVRVDDHGLARWFLPRTFPIRDERHQVIGSAIMLADVTELRRLDEIKNHLLATAAHELKTPLTSIRMAMHLIAEQRVGDLNERQRGLFAAARDDSDRLHNIVETLLDMDRIRSGAAIMELRPVSGQALIQACVEPHRERLAQAGIALRIETPQRPVTVRADEKRLKHVFGNLLDNAIRFTPSGGCITISLNLRNGTFAHFSVADTGSGIPDELQMRVFDRFFRPRVNRAKAGRAWGWRSCGRSSKRTAGACGWKAAKVAAPPCILSCQFSIDLCLRKLIMSPPTETSLETKTKTSTEPDEQPAARRRRILLADDEGRIRLVLRACLEAEGYEVFEAADGLEALDAIIRTAPDLLILDLAMPNLDGLRTVEHLSGLHGQLKPRIIILTAWGSGPAMLKTLGLGASMFLEKPVTPQALLDAVKQVFAEPRDSKQGIPIDWSAVLADENEVSEN